MLTRGSRPAGPGCHRSNGPDGPEGPVPSLARVSPASAGAGNASRGCSDGHVCTDDPSAEGASVDAAMLLTGTEGGGPGDASVLTPHAAHGAAGSGARRDTAHHGCGCPETRGVALGAARLPQLICCRALTMPYSASARGGISRRRARVLAGSAVPHSGLRPTPSVPSPRGSVTRSGSRSSPWRRRGRR